MVARLGLTGAGSSKTRRAKTGRAMTGAFLIAMLCLGPALALASDSVDPNQPEAPATILAGQVRQQGRPCDKPVGASRDATLSQPHQPVWVLVCSNATYWISVCADTAPQVEVIGGGP
jgi:hypothetical protein